MPGAVIGHKVGNSSVFSRPSSFLCSLSRPRLLHTTGDRLPHVMLNVHLPQAEIWPQMDTGGVVLLKDRLNLNKPKYSPVFTSVSGLQLQTSLQLLVLQTHVHISDQSLKSDPSFSLKRTNSAQSLTPGQWEFIQISMSQSLRFYHILKLKLRENDFCHWLSITG